MCIFVALRLRGYLRMISKSIFFIFGYLRHFMQKQSFETKNSGNKSLIISQSSKQKLSKNQEAFNKLTQKIEKLQKDIAKKQAQLDLAIKMYGTKLHPLQMQLTQMRHQLILVLYANYIENKLSKVDQRHLKEILLAHLEIYTHAIDTEPDEQIKAIISALEGVDYEQIMEAQKKEMQDEVKQMFKRMKVDLDGVDMDDDVEMFKKMKELQEKMVAEEQKKFDQFFKWESNPKQKAKKKTAKQIAYEKMQEEVELMKQKNISSIYKQLAKLFHPDLEQDAERKLEKELLMRELTVAYESKNLHALLTLELKWIHKEQAHLESLTEEKLAIYLQILREQAHELEHQKQDLFMQPQYAVLANTFGIDVQRYPVQTVEHEVEMANYTIQICQKEIALYSSTTALHHLKKLIKNWKQKSKAFDDDLPF